jgi:hypothetical protein
MAMNGNEWQRLGSAIESGGVQDLGANTRCSRDV